MSAPDFGDPAPPRTGMVLGKFMPPHLGHQFLLDFARAFVPQLTVLVCSLKREPVPGELRHRWVSELAPGADVRHVTDENPSEPHEHPDFWRIWTDTVRRHVPAGPDVVFTSEDYGDELARRLGARHVIVDKARELVPVSGTRLRERPLEHWRFLPACVRPYYAKRVVVYGPESTGKTTLCKRLADQYGTAWAAEYARGYLDHKRAFCEPADIAWIARGHAAAEDALARQCNRVLFLDTDLLMTTMYSEWYYGTCPDWVREEAARRRYDLYLLCDVDVPWVADPQRDQPHRRRELIERCVGDLTRHGRNFRWVRGTWDERFAAATAAVDELLAS